MIASLLEEIREWRDNYFRLGHELGEIINDLQDKIVALTNENRRLKRENFNLRKTKRRRK